MKRNAIRRVGGLSLFAVAMVACAPVNFFTSVKETPKEYSRNYCCGEVAVPKSMDKRNPWIVYSDRDKNATYYQPGGRVALKEASFMEAFAVTGEKEGFLELVKYEVGNFENGRIKDKSKAEYYGWMHRDHLVLSSRAVTDVATGHCIKMLTMVKDTLPLKKAEEYFTDKGVTLFKDPDLLAPEGSLPLHQPVFLLKKSRDNTKCFIAGQERLSPETVGSMVAGWVSSSLVMPWGEYLYWNYAGLGYRDYAFCGRLGVDYTPYMTELRNEQRLQGFDRLLPVNAIYSATDTLAKVRTKYPIPLLDGSKNFVYALSGKRITRSDLQGIVSKRKRINVVLAFSPERSVYEKMPQLVSSFQKLREVFAKYSPETTIRLGYHTSFYSDRSLGKSPLSGNVDSVLNQMSSGFNGEKSGLCFSTEAFASLKSSLDFFDGHEGESNLLVQVGRHSNSRPKGFSEIIDKLVGNNCRIVGFQHQSDQGSACNNYVLQLEEMVAQSSRKLGQKKLDFLVHSDQLVAVNQFREVQENAYALDFPRSSMWQGWILFPKKKELLPCDMLVSVVDSILNEMVADNADVVSHIQEAFNVSGRGHTTVAPQWKVFAGVPEGFKADGVNSQSLQSADPYTLFPLDLFVPKDSLSTSDYYLFLTESELDRVRSFLDDLTKVRIDIKGKLSRNAEKVKSATCMDLFEKPNAVDTVSYEKEYLNTSKARKSMQKSFLKWAVDEKVYPKKARELKKQTLSKNQQEVFSMPSFNPLLDSYTLGVLKDKRRLPDWEFDELQSYYLKKRRQLEEAVTTENRYEFNGQVYYLVKSDCLP